MTLSARQQDILYKTVFEYIEQAQPISSGWLETRYDMPFSPATIRAELLGLCEEGYLEQPHTSSGRVPTDKGYRFFVDDVLQDEDFDELSMQGDLYEVGHKLAEISSNLIIISVPQKSFLWKEGWEEVLRAPEFENKGGLDRFTSFLKDVERGIKKFRSKKDMDIYIGKENPFSKEQDFSIMIAGYSFGDQEEGFMALVGPKRMAYQKNIGLLHSLRRVFTP